MTITLTDEESRLVLQAIEITLRSQGVLPLLDLAKKINVTIEKPVKPAATKKKRST